MGEDGVDGNGQLQRHHGASPVTVLHSHEFCCNVNKCLEQHLTGILQIYV